MILQLSLLVSVSLYAQTWTQLGIDIDGEANHDWSGYSVSFSADGNIVAIGAISNNSGSGSTGHGRVFKYISGSWIQQGADIDGEANGDLSGYSVSLSADGSIVAVGAFANAGGGEGRGHVRVYKFMSGTWTQQGIDIDGEANYDASGNSVSLSSDGRIVAIGSFYNAGFDESQRGHVRVYKFMSGTWTQQGADIDGEADSDQSGYSISLSSDGNMLAIGAPKNDGNNGLDRGHVRVYKYLSGVWTQQGADIDGQVDLEQSGWSVSLSSDGNTVAIGAPSASVYNAPSRTRVYKFISDTWTQQGSDIDGEAEGDQSGWSISLSTDGNTIAIGSNFNDGSTGSGSGNVRVYKYYGTAWIQQGFDIDGEAISDQSGYSVSLSADGRRVAIGAPFNGGTTDRGHVRVFGFICPTFTPSFSPICVLGNPLNLSSSEGITYLWQGPNGFKSSIATPSKPKTTKADFGIYSITITGTSGCTASATLSVYTGVGNISAGSNSPVCNGGTIKLLAISQAPASFKWTKQFGATVYKGANINIGPGVKPKDGGIYTVFITGENGCIVKQEISVIVSAVPCFVSRLAIGESESEIGMEINAYPNPTSKLLTVEVKLATPSTLKLNLYNAKGNSLDEWNLSDETTIHHKQIDMSFYTDGLYLIQAQNKNGRQIKRVVKVE